MSEKPGYLLTLVVLVLISGVGGFVLGRNNSGAISIPSTSSNSLYTSQTALIQGTVTKVTDKTITVKNTAGVEGTVELGSNVLISKLNTAQGGLPATPSSDLKQIELNKAAVVNLQMIDGKFKVMSVTSIPSQAPTPVAPPVSK